MFFAATAFLFLLAAGLAVALPLVLGARGRPDAPVEGGAAVYRDQLRELERELAEGAIDRDAYAAARGEVGRRLLNAEAETGSRTAGSGPSRWRWGGIVTIVATFAIAAIIYPFLGSPGAVDQPLAARLESAQPDLAVLVASVERHLAQNPDDGRGWDVIAPVYFGQNRLDEARDAYSNAIRLSGPSADRLVGLGEAMLAGASGVVTDEAVAAFRQADALPGGDDRASYFLALAAEQGGDHAEALRRFSELEKKARADGAWSETIAGHVDANRRALTDTGVVANGPDRETIEAAAGLSTDERKDMVNGMVTSLADRLSANPDDLEGWMRLIRSYKVLGDETKAHTALSQAISFYGDGSAAADQLSALAAALGLQEANR